MDVLHLVTIMRSVCQSKLVEKIKWYSVYGFTKPVTKTCCSWLVLVISISLMYQLKGNSLGDNLVIHSQVSIGYRVSTYDTRE